MSEVAAIQHKLPSEVLDGMTWPEYQGLQAFWSRWPPMNVSLAMLARISPYHLSEKESADGELTDADMALLQSLAGGVSG